MSQSFMAELQNSNFGNSSPATNQEKDNTNANELDAEDALGASDQNIKSSAPLGAGTPGTSDETTTSPDIALRVANLENVFLRLISKAHLECLKRDDLEKAFARSLSDNLLHDLKTLSLSCGQDEQCHTDIQKLIDNIAPLESLGKESSACADIEKIFSSWMSYLDS